MNFIFRYVSVAVALLVCGSSLLYAKSARKLVDEGNVAYSAGNHSNALSRYNQAGEIVDDQSRILFNKGANYYRQGDFTNAFDSFDSASLKSTDSWVESRSKFNMGNCQFEMAKAQQADDPEKALELYSDSVAHFRGAYSVDPELREAAENIEGVRMRMMAVMEEIKRRKEQQQQQQDMAKELKKMIDDQKEALKDNKENSKPQQNESDKQQQQSEQKKQSDKQKQMSDKSKDMADQAKQQPQQQQGAKQEQKPKLDEAAKHLDNASEEQKKAAEKLDKGEGKEAEKNQEKAVEDLEKALKALSDDQKQQKKKDQQKDQQKQDNKDKKSEQKQDDKQDQEQKQPEQGKPEDSDQEAEQEFTPLLDEAKDIIKEEKENAKIRRIKQADWQKVDKDW